MHMHTYMCMHMHTYTCMCMCMCMCMHARVYQKTWSEDQAKHVDVQNGEGVATST